MNLNGVEYYYVRNAQGDIIGLIDKTGTQVVTYNYDAWGKLISIDGSLRDSLGVMNPYRYRGYRFDSETGLYYLQSRYYSPEWGRFINADALGGSVGELLSHNIFAYCKNNAVNMSDRDCFRPVFDDEETQREYDDWVRTQRPIAQSESGSKSKSVEVDDKPIYTAPTQYTNNGYGVSKTEEKMYFDSKAAAELYLYKEAYGTNIYKMTGEITGGAILDKLKDLAMKNATDKAGPVFFIAGLEMTSVDLAHEAIFDSTMQQIDIANSLKICLTKTHIDPGPRGGVFDYIGYFYGVGTY